MLVSSPSGRKYRFARSGETVAAAIQRYDGFGVTVRCGHGFEQAPRHQLQNLIFPQGQSFQIGVSGADGGNDGVVVADHFTVADLGCVDFLRHVHAAYGTGRSDMSGNAEFHIVGQIPAVRPGIGAELLFVESLQIVQRLLRGVTQDAVRVPLEGGQIIERRRLFGFLFALDTYDSSLILTSSQNKFGGASVRHSFRHGGEAAIELDGVERFRDKGRDLRLPLDQQRQRGRHDPPDVQRPSVEQGEIPGGVDAHQPVSPRAAQRRLMQPVKVPAGTQVLKALADRRILHTGDPQALHGLGAARHVINGAEDQLAFPSGVAGVDDLGRVRGAQQLPQHVKLLALVRGDRKPERLRDDGQVFHAPLGIVGVIGRSVRQLRQMPVTPGNDVAAAGEIPVVPLLRADHGGDALGNRGLFRDDQTIAHFFSRSLSR